MVVGAVSNIETLTPTTARATTARVDVKMRRPSALLLATAATAAAFSHPPLLKPLEKFQRVPPPQLSDADAQEAFLELVKRRAAIQTPLDTSFWRPYVRGASADTIPALKAEIDQLGEAAALTDAALKAAQAKHAAETGRVRKERKAEAAARQAEEQKATEAKRQVEAKREQQAFKSTSLLEQLTADQFAFVAPEWH